MSDPVSTFPWAVPGAKCVCIAREFHFVRRPTLRQWIEDLFSRDPRHGEIVVIDRVVTVRGILGFYLKGFRHPYAAACFRPLVTRTQEQDVALFALILHGWPAEVRDHDVDGIRDAVDALAKRAKGEA